MFLATFAKVRTAHRTEAEKVRTAFGQAQILVPKSPAKMAKSRNVKNSLPMYLFRLISLRRGEVWALFQEITVNRTV